MSPSRFWEANSSGVPFSGVEMSFLGVGFFQGAAMILAWFRTPKLTVEVLGADIVVTMPGTSCQVVYTRTEDNRASSPAFFGRQGAGRKAQDHLREVSRPSLDSSQCGGQGDRLDRAMTATTPPRR